MILCSQLTFLLKNPVLSKYLSSFFYVFIPFKARDNQTIKINYHLYVIVFLIFVKDGRDNMKKLTLIYELSMFTLAVISFFLIWTQPIKFYYMGKIVWIIFLIDVFTRFLLSKNKKEWVKKNYLDFVAIIPLNTVFQLARFARLFRIVKLFLVTKHYFMPFFQFIQTNGLTKVFSITFISILFSAIPITLFEPSIKSYNDGIWLAIVTVTTVGYGDMSPETLIGRIATVYLMFVGIGLVSMITGTIATYFIKSKSNSNIKESIKKDIDNIENLSNDEIESLIKIIRTYQN